MPSSHSTGNKTKNTFSNWYVLLLFFTLLPIYPLVAQKGVLLQHDVFASDLLHNQFPYRVLLGKYLSGGTFPLWIPDLFSGTPFLAQIEAGVLYLPNWIFFGFFKPFIALNLSIIFTFLLGAGGTFALARHYGADNISAALGGLVFALAGFNISHIHHMNMHEASAILPWLLFCLENKFKTGSNRWFVLLSLLLALQIFAGHPQITYYSLLFLFFRYLIYLYFTICKNCGSNIYNRPSKEINNFISFLSSIILGIGLAAIQLITAYKFNENSMRGKGLDWDFASAFPYYLPDLLTFFYPPASGMVEQLNYTGTVQWENYGYIGIVPLFLIIFSAFIPRRKITWFYIITILLSLFIAIGPATPLYKLLWEFLPGMKLFRFPTRFLLLTTVAAAILVTLGATYLGDIITKQKSPALAKVTLLLLFLITSLDLYHWQKKRIPIDDIKEWQQNSPINFITKKMAGQGRVYTLAGHEIWNKTARISQGFIKGFQHYRQAGQIPFGNYALLHNINNVAGYTNMLSDRTAAFWCWYNQDLLPKLFQPAQYNIQTLQLTDSFVSLLNIANVKYLLSPYPVKNSKFKLVWAGHVNLYENKAILPRAYLAYSWQKVNSIDEAADWLFDPAHNYLPAIEGIGLSKLSARPKIKPITVISPSPHKMELTIRSANEGYLLLTDSFDQGWTAKTDGKPAKIYIANGYQMAIRINSNTKKISLSYKPSGFTLGWIISIVSLGLLFAWWRKEHTLLFSANNIEQIKHVN